MERWKDVILNSIAVILLIFTFWFIYNDTKSYKEVCENINSPITNKFHEVESINNFGATRNNYYLYLDNGERRNVDVDFFVSCKIGDVISYRECWREKIKE